MRDLRRQLEVVHPPPWLTPPPATLGDGRCNTNSCTVAIVGNHCIDLGRYLVVRAVPHRATRPCGSAFHVRKRFPPGELPVYPDLRLTVSPAVHSCEYKSNAQACMYRQVCKRLLDVRAGAKHAISTEHLAQVATGCDLRGVWQAPPTISPLINHWSTALDHGRVAFARPRVRRNQRPRARR